jgi:putative N6-adenine-specific DNA methylase
MPARPAGPTELLSAFAVTAPGLEPLCATELTALGLGGAVEPGGVSWSGTLDTVARANLWLRTASRVLVRVAQFRATSFFELERHARRIPWPRFVAAGAAVEFRVTCRKSRLYHSDAVAQRLAESVERAVSGARIVRPTGTAGDDEPPVAERRQLFVARFDHDRCTVSADSSGERLHMRGYRQQLAKAPLRETLAAAVLLGADWSGEIPLVDPMCGSGTIPIEAARIARRIAPGRDRPFAFLAWPEVDRRQWVSRVTEARDGELGGTRVRIEGYDRDGGAITAARANAERAGVASDIEFGVQPLSALKNAPAAGLIAVNPPYGIRIGEADRLRNLYAQIGNVQRARRPGWSVALLAADPQLAGQTRLAFEERWRSSNGGIPVKLLVTTG